MSNIIHVAPAPYDEKDGFSNDTIALPPPTYTRELTNAPEKPKKETFSDVIQQFSDNTTAHGIPRIVNAKYMWSKFLWFIVVGGSTGVFLWQSTLLVKEFFSWPVEVSIDVFSKTDVDFPAVTVCNMNRLRRSEMEGTRFEGILAIDGGANETIWDYDGFEWYFYSDIYSDLSATSEPSTEAPIGRRRRRSVNNKDYPEPSLDEFHADEDGAQPSRKSNDRSQRREQFKQRKAPGHHKGQMHPSEINLDSPVDYPDHEDYPTQGQGTNQRKHHPVDRKKYNEAIRKLMTPEFEARKQKMEARKKERHEHFEKVKAKLDQLKAEGKLPNHLRRSKRAGGSSSSSSSSVMSSSSIGGGGGSSSFGNSLDYSWFDDFGWDFDTNELDFEYYDYGWGDIANENDWQGFYDNSKMEDFSDLADVANPTDDELRGIGHQAEDFILQCTFDKRPCNYTFFKQWQNKNYGNCYTFNHGHNEPVRQTSKSGSQYGLHLTLFIEQPEYVGLFSQESGVRMTVSPQGVAPFPEDLGITAGPGLSTSVGIRQYNYVRQPHPYGNCTTGEEVYMVNTDYDYSVVLCKKECLQKNLIERCGCVSDILIDHDKCSFLNVTQQRCRQVVEALYEDDELNCTKPCKNPCSEVSYTTQVSSSLWPSERYESHLYDVLADKSIKAAITLQDVSASRKNLVRLKIFFEELNFQNIIQSKAYRIENLLGDIGGTLGLYIGLSIITVTEIIVFFFHTCRFFFCRSKMA